LEGDNNNKSGSAALVHSGKHLTTTNTAITLRFGNMRIIYVRERTMTIRVDRIDFDSDIMQVRMAGVTIVEQEDVPVGAHTLTLEKQQKGILGSHFWGILDEATHPDQQAEVAAVVM
jgi:stalled ribosome rescue protein Dom34